MNHSELLFEDYCRRTGIAAIKFPTASSRTPDYRLDYWGYEVICEVKEIDKNSYEKHLEALSPEKWGEEECVYYGGSPGDRLRKKIADAAPQLKAVSQGILPTLLLVWNSVANYPEICDDYAVSVSMFGYEAALISNQVAPEGGAQILRRWHGPKKRITPQCNTSLSAIGILQSLGSNLSVRIFHNPFATKPLDHARFSPTNCVHFVPADDPQHNFNNWREVDGT